MRTETVAYGESLEEQLAPNRSLINMEWRNEHVNKYLFRYIFGEKHNIAAVVLWHLFIYVGSGESTFKFKI